MPIKIEELRKLGPVRQRCKTFQRYAGAFTVDGFNFAVNLFCSAEGKISCVSFYNASSKKQNKEQYVKHIDKRKKYSGEYLESHRKEMTERAAKWQKENPERTCELHRKIFAKRKRELGYKPLNEPFEGADGHHVNKEVIIYIPTALHRSIRHNVFTGKNMEEINKLAFEWLDRELIRKAFDELKEKET